MVWKLRLKTEKKNHLGALQRKKFHTSKITMEVGVFCLYIDCTLLKVFRYYDLSVLFMSVMGFPKKKFGLV